MPGDLNLKWTQPLCVAGVNILMLLALYAGYRHGGRFLTPLLDVHKLVSGTYWTTQSLRRAEYAPRLLVIFYAGTVRNSSFCLHSSRMPVPLTSRRVAGCTACDKTRAVYHRSVRAALVHTAALPAPFTSSSMHKPTLRRKETTGTGSNMS